MTSKIALKGSSRNTSRFAIALVVALFFMWGVANNLNDILIAQFKKAFTLTDFQSGLVQSAFYFGYFCLAIPASIVMRRYGFRSGIVVGLLGYATGAFLFIPAANVESYPFFLLALFVMASGLAFLETSANPYIAALGPAETADQRLNLAQAFNPLGSITGVLIGKFFIFSDEALTPEAISTMSPDALSAYLSEEVQAVKLPYTAIGVIVLIWAALILLAKFPPVSRGQDDGNTLSQSGSVMNLFDRQYTNLWLGVFAQFCYVGAQVGIWSYLIRYAQVTSPGMSERHASTYLLVSLVAFVAGRFVGTAVMSRISGVRLLQLFALVSIGFCLIAAWVGGMVGLYALVGTSFFMSIMYPTIFSRSIKGLDDMMKSASSVLVMAIIGGAILTALMGWISDLSSIQTAMLVPLFCFLAVLVFALQTDRLQGHNSQKL